LLNGSGWVLTEEKGRGGAGVKKERRNGKVDARGVNTLECVRHEREQGLRGAAFASLVWRSGPKERVSWRTQRSKLREDSGVAVWKSKGSEEMKGLGEKGEEEEKKREKRWVTQTVKKRELRKESLKGNSRD